MTRVFTLASLFPHLTEHLLRAEVLGLCLVSERLSKHVAQASDGCVVCYDRADICPRFSGRPWFLTLG